MKTILNSIIKIMRTNMKKENNIINNIMITINNNVGNIILDIKTSSINQLIKSHLKKPNFVPQSCPNVREKKAKVIFILIYK